jgi:hypothetical protein
MLEEDDVGDDEVVEDNQDDRLLQVESLAVYPLTSSDEPDDDALETI